jgi:hypothetical protein
MQISLPERVVPTKLDGTPVGGAQANALVKTQTITVTGLTPGKTYRFRVKARNYCGANETPWYPAAGYVRQAIPALSGPINLPGGTDVADRNSRATECRSRHADRYVAAPWSKAVSPSPGSIAHAARRHSIKLGCSPHMPFAPEVLMCSLKPPNGGTPRHNA